MRYIILILGVGVAYLIFVGIAKSQDIPPTECEIEIGKMMEVAAKYITQEATALQMVNDLKEILNEKDAEIALLNKQVHHSIVK